MEWKDIQSETDKTLQWKYEPERKLQIFEILKNLYVLIHSASLQHFA